MKSTTTMGIASQGNQATLDYASSFLGSADSSTALAMDLHLLMAMAE